MSDKNYLSDDQNWDEIFEDEDQSLGETFSKISKYWHNLQKDMRKDMNDVLDDNEYHAFLEDLKSDPDTVKYASDLKKMRAISKAADKAVSVIGKCIDGAAALLNAKN